MGKGVKMNPLRYPIVTGGLCFILVIGAVSGSRASTDGTEAVTIQGDVQQTYESRHFNDVWAFNVDTGVWEEIHPSGTLPPETRNHAAVYDPLNQRMIFSGGQSNWSVWELSLVKGTEAWSIVQPATGSFPGTFYGQDILYSATLESIIGYGSSSTNLFVWNVRTDVAETIATASPPSRRQWYAVGLDEARMRLLLFGGGLAEYDVFDELWELNLTAGSNIWQLRPPLGENPPEKWLFRGVVDPFRERFIIFGGKSYFGWGAGEFADYECKTYELNLGTNAWSLVPAVTPPPPRGQFGVAWDGVKRQMHVFGGIDGVNDILTTYNELWTYDTDSQSWFEQLPVGPKPEARRMPTAVFDALNRRIVIFGGELIQLAGIVRAAIEVPRNGQQIDGDRVTIAAKILAGEITAASHILFQYRQPSFTGEWQDILPAGDGESNPDPDSPFLVHWDVTEFPEGEVDLRALATSISGATDPGPVETTVTINHATPEIYQTTTGDGHLQLAYTLDDRALSDLGSADSTSSDTPNASDFYVRVRIPAETFLPGTILYITFVDLADHPELNPDGFNIGFVVDLSVSGDQSAFPTGKTVTLIIQYPDDDQNGIVDHTSVAEETLSIYSWTAPGILEELDEVTVDPDSNLVRGETTHFTLFTVIGHPASAQTTGVGRWDGYR